VFQGQLAAITKGHGLAIMPLFPASHGFAAGAPAAVQALAACFEVSAHQNMFVAVAVMG
jgi:hypothetical protein